MKNLFAGSFSSLLLGASMAIALPAYANNKNVEEAIHDRIDLGMFYQALMANGILTELDENKDYTVFAPTNSSFGKLPREQYACFYDGTCRAEAAPILRNHIAIGAYTDSDLTHQSGGIESINPGRDIHISEPSRHDYAVDGHMIVYMSSIYSGKLYKIEGVIADQEELNALAHPQLHTADAPAAATAEDGDDVPDTTCEMDDCSDRAPTITTTTTTTVVTPPALVPPANVVAVPTMTTPTPSVLPPTAPATAAPAAGVAEPPIKALYPPEQ